MSSKASQIRQKAQQFQQMSQQAINQFRAQRADSLQRLVPGWNSQADIDATRAALEQAGIDLVPVA